MRGIGYSSRPTDLQIARHFLPTIENVIFRSATPLEFFTDSNRSYTRCSSDRDLPFSMTGFVFSTIALPANARTTGADAEKTGINLTDESG